MTSLFYKILDNFGECRGANGSDAKRVRVHTEGATDGFISIGALSAPLKGGTARLDLSPLADGEYAPTLHLDGSTVRLESIVKQGSNITVSRSDRMMLLTLAKRLEAAEERIAGLTALMEEHEEAIHGKPILDFLA